MVCLFQLHAFCRRPAQPVGRGFDYRYGLAAKPATSRLFGEIRPVLVADFRLFWGLYDVYASAWFVVIMMFLVISTGLCLIRNVPPFLREIRSFRENAKEKSLAAMRHSIVLDGQVTPEVAQRYLEVQGYGCKTVTREDGSVLVAAKKRRDEQMGLYLCPCRADCDLFGRFDRQQYPAENRYAHRPSRAGQYGGLCQRL